MVPAFRELAPIIQNSKKWIFCVGNAYFDTRMLVSLFAGKNLAEDKCCVS